MGFLVALLLLIAPHARADDVTRVALSIGRSMEWPTARRSQIAVSNGAVIRVADLGDRVRITAKKLGRSVVSERGGRVVEVDVLPEPLMRLHARLSEALRGRRGLELVGQGRSLVVRGRLLRWDDWRALAVAARGESEVYAFAADIAPDVRTEAAAKLSALLREAHLPDAALELSPRAALTIPASPADLKERYARVLGAYGFRIESSAAALSLEPLVRVRLVVAEIRRKLMRRFGITWPPAIGARLLPQMELPLGNTLDVGLNALEERGLGKVLASPTLLCRSGKEAQFLAGGEFPIKIADFKSHDVLWKSYGVRLKIRPVADFGGRMSIALEAEVSMLDMANTVDGIPGLLSNRVESHFDLSSPRTIVLSGLIKKEWGDAMSGLPGLGSIPILGPLFSSRDFHNQETELVIFATPEVVDPSGQSL